MAKKRNSLKKKQGPIMTGKFSVDSSRMYIAAGLICFHILPLLFVFWGETGQTMLQTVFMLIINPLILFCINCFHACRLGFCVKFPLIMTVLSSASVLMYYGLPAETLIITTLVCLLDYAVLSFVSELLGGFLKKLIGGY